MYEQGTINYKIRLVRSVEVGFFREIEDAAAVLFSGLDIVDEAKWVSFSLDEVYWLATLGQVWAACLDDDQPIGMIIASVRDGEVYVEELHVVPEHGRRGLGGRLLERVCEWAEEQGYPGVTLSTFRDVPWNGPFYRKHAFRDLKAKEWTQGMQAIRERETVHGLRPEERVFMRRDLNRKNSKKIRE